MLKKGNIIELEIEKMTFGGEGLGFYEGLAVFVPMSVPEDRLKIEIVSVKKTHARGIIKEIVKASVYRIEDYGKISFEDFLGCDFAMIKYKKQLEYKKEMTKDVLDRIGKVSDYRLFDTIGSDNPYNYRNKIIEPFGKKDGKIISGFYKKRSHDIFETEENWLQPEEVQKLLEILKIELNKQKISVYNEVKHSGLLRHVMVRKNTEGHMMLVVVVKGKTNSKLRFAIKKTIEKVPMLKSVYISTNNKRGNFALGTENELIFGDEFITEELFGIRFNISPLSFFQINIEQTKKLYSTAIDYFEDISNKVIVDAYSGTGTIGMLVARKAKKVYGIEYVESATIDAIKTAKENNIDNVEFINGKVEDKLSLLLDEGRQIDGIIFDPPRKGIEEEVLRKVAEKKINNIVYVSCNPSTFARDMRILGEYGYNLERVQPVDMFPQTNHIELVAKILI